jgi:hypothetical protein
VPVLDLNQPEAIGEFILQHVGLHLHAVGSASRPIAGQG